MNNTRNTFFPMIIIGGLFFMFGFVTWLNGSLIPFLQIACELNHMQAYEENAEIISGVVSKDHVHILVSIDPSTSISKLVQYLKGKTSRKLQQEFSELRKRYWGQYLWARGYFVVSTGNVSTKMIEEYIARHVEQKEHGKDMFKVDE